MQLHPTVQNRTYRPGPVFDSLGTSVACQDLPDPSSPTGAFFYPFTDASVQDSVRVGAGGKKELVGKAGISNWV